MCKAMEELLNDEKIQTALRMLAKNKYLYKEIAVLYEAAVYFFIIYSA